uniref:Uncharacterized protein n=1 Tax=Chromera velia CCMP2878 TaxID=1169474 RepID=A0A0G4I3G6_9ALVE|eukprot:Cvel_10667.t1-p1 / transcript=Cvel_10667.t1 / gene=Cvel_10667 / organism=Chromera_velia_CCMP2878 / gene_product=hypothetical protein / transcript_product=hypothetical protein / location=Cvel_scaffold648:48024-50330(+) / protein_length=769 / sequence_SO=supercontig / SO=protein_coding / is_pseudo=false
MSATALQQIFGGGSLGEGLLGAAILGANEPVLSFIRSNLDSSAALFENVKRESERPREEGEEEGFLSELVMPRKLMKSRCSPLINAAVHSPQPVRMLKWIGKEFEVSFAALHLLLPLYWRVCFAEQPLPYSLLRFLSSKGGVLNEMYPKILDHLAKFGRLPELIREERRCLKAKARRVKAREGPLKGGDLNSLLSHLLLVTQFPDGIDEEFHWGSWSRVCEKAAENGHLNVLKWARLELEPHETPQPAEVCPDDNCSEKSDDHDEETEGGEGVPSDSELGEGGAEGAQGEAAVGAGSDQKQGGEGEREKGQPVRDCLCGAPAAERLMKFPWGDGQGATEALSAKHTATFKWMMYEAEEVCPFHADLYMSAVCSEDEATIREIDRLGRERGGEGFTEMAIESALDYKSMEVLEVLLDLDPQSFPSYAYSCLFNRSDEVGGEEEVVEFARKLAKKGVEPSSGVYSCLAGNLEIEWDDAEDCSQGQDEWADRVLSVVDIVARADRKVEPSAEIYAEAVGCPSVRFLKSVRELPQRPSWEAPAEVSKAVEKFKELQNLESEEPSGSDGVYEKNPAVSTVISGLLGCLRYLCDPSQRYAKAVGRLTKEGDREEGHFAISWLLNYLGPSVDHRKPVYSHESLSAYIEEKRAERESPIIQEKKNLVREVWEGIVRLAARLYLEFGYSDILPFFLLDSAEGGDVCAGLDLAGCPDLGGLLRRVTLAFRREECPEEHFVKSNQVNGGEEEEQGGRELEGEEELLGKGKFRPRSVSCSF